MAVVGCCWLVVVAVVCSCLLSCVCSWLALVIIGFVDSFCFFVVCCLVVCCRLFVVGC